MVAVSNDGGARAWRWDGATVDGVLGGGDAIAILAGAEVVVVDAATGLTLTRWRSHDGYVGRVALALRGTDTRLASYEDGAVVVRLDTEDAVAFDNEVELAVPVVPNW